MAKLDKLPERAIISGLKGTVDFYMWNGIACARSWPRYRPRVPTPAEKANQDAFAYAMRLWKTLPANIKEAYIAQAENSAYRPQDVFIQLYLKGVDYEVDAP